MARKAPKPPPPPFGLDERTYAQLWFFALPVLGLALGVAALATLLSVLPDAWWARFVSVVVGLVVGTVVVRAGRALHRRLGVGAQKYDDGRPDDR